MKNTTTLSAVATMLIAAQANAVTVQTKEVNAAPTAAVKAPAVKVLTPSEAKAALGRAFSVQMTHPN